VPLASVMKIQVKGYLSLREVIGDQRREIAAGAVTIRELIQQLALELGDGFAEMVADVVAGREQPRMAILVNGRHGSHLPAGLDTELQDGDEVAIFPPAMGG
jgi:molybdopterin synthase sulfur carrier subunit